MFKRELSINESYSLNEKEYHFELLKKNYITRRVSDIYKLRTELENRNFKFLLEYAYQIIGNCEMYSFKELTFFGQMLKNATLNEDTSKISESVDALSHYLDGVNASLM